jgi:hypothetical protein
MVALFGNKRQFATPSEIDLDLRVGDVRGDFAYRRFAVMLTARPTPQLARIAAVSGAAAI